MPYELLLLGAILFVLDIKLGSVDKKSLTLTFFTAYGLLMCPYLVYSYVGLNDSWSLSLFMYFVSLTIFHFGEFIVQSYFHYHEANFSTFLLDHSKEYSYAIIIAFTEHFSKLLLPYPVFYPITIIGGIITSIGHIFRIGSEINCGRNFSHKIRYAKKYDHKLVVSGFYRLCRHPSYFGWFLWSVGTQIMLGNIICMLGFYKVSISFFQDRIRHEEEILCGFFGIYYYEFKKNTSQFFPFWNNFLMETS